MNCHRVARVMLGVGIALVPAGCAGPFAAKDFRSVIPTTERLRDIARVRLEEQSRTPPVTVDDAASDDLTTMLEPRAPGEEVTLSLEDVRLAALANNLDIRVALLSPSIAATSIDEEQARFESTFNANARWTRTDSPTSVATEGSMIQSRNFDVGVDVPLRTGGSVAVTLPVAKTATNNPFSLLDPSYTTDVRFSIAQPLLRNAGTRVNTHAIRVAEYQHDISATQTKLEATRILANADRAYWRLYAAKRELEVAQVQYELAVEQLERARRQVDAEVAAEVEVLRAASGVAERLERIIVTENTVRRRGRDLRRIMNNPRLPLDADVAFVLETQPDPLGLDLDADDLARHAIANRME
ncbi:MAG: TolC family protein, partial [Phycisphaerae bacterium]|nr:TolC family protein [Phycisphaerae bacterium]